MTASIFDQRAAEWDNNPGRVALARAVAEAIRHAIPLRADGRLLDCGAGTGLLTLNLLPCVAEMVATDSSAGMLDVLRQKLAAAGLKNVITLLWDVATEACPAQGFDGVCSSMMLHHLRDVPAALHRMEAALAPGGWLAVADLVTEDGSFHSDPTGVYHHGFDPQTIARWLTGAGCTDVTVREAHRMVKPDPAGHEHSYPIFLAVGRRQMN